MWIPQRQEAIAKMQIGLQPGVSYPNFDTAYLCACINCRKPLINLKVNNYFSLIERISREFIIFEFRDDIMRQISRIINITQRISSLYIWNRKEFQFQFQSKLIIVEIRSKQDILLQRFLFSCCDKCWKTRAIYLSDSWQFHSRKVFSVSLISISSRLESRSIRSFEPSRKNYMEEGALFPSNMIYQSFQR